jgi:ABC-type phosphate transport system auxiliary subunit
MQRIERLIDNETEALRSRAAIDLNESNNRKSQAVLELSLVVRSLEGVPLDAELVQRLKTLRGKLETNRAVLRRHLEAVREVANVVAETIQDMEGDGTYSQHAATGTADR